MNRIFPVSFRCDLVERDRIECAAEAAGLSTSEFIRRAALAADPQQLAGPRPAGVPRTPIRSRRPPSTANIKPFRVPFVHGLEGLGFERVVQHAARQMGMDQCSVAMVLTHVTDAIANQMAAGQVVRWPGLFVAAAYLSRRRDGRRNVFPRFQAAPPLNRTVAEKCAPGHERNVEMDNHRKRARRQGVQHVADVMQRVRSAIVNQDLRALRVVESIWRDESEAHAI